MGSLVVVAGAAAIMVAGDFAARGNDAFGHFTDAAGVAQLLGRHGHGLGAIFAIVLFDASIFGAAAVTLSTSYAFGDFFGLRHSLHRGFKDAKPFYLSYTAMVLVAAGIVLIPGALLGLITTSVQALAGLLRPSASVFLLLLCNDREVLGPWVNQQWLNAVAAVIVAVLLVLSGTLMATTLFPNINVTAVFVGLAIVLAAGGILVIGALAVMSRRKGQPTVSPQRLMSSVDKRSWRMPPLALLKPVRWSPGLRVGILAMRAYLIASAVLLL
jgi:hypothetical protein